MGHLTPLLGWLLSASRPAALLRFRSTVDDARPTPLVGAKLTVGTGVGKGVGGGMSPNVGKGVDTPVGRVNCSVGARVWLVPAWATATEAESRTVSFIILLDRLSMGQLNSSRNGWRRRWTIDNRCNKRSVVCVAADSHDDCGSTAAVGGSSALALFCRSSSREVESTLLSLFFEKTNDLSQRLSFGPCLFRVRRRKRGALCRRRANSLASPCAFYVVSSKKKYESKCESACVSSPPLLLRYDMVLLQ